MKTENLILEYKRKNREGFTSDELVDLVRQIKSLSPNTFKPSIFYKTLNGDTVSRINGEIITPLERVLNVYRKSLVYLPDIMES